jgi:hypothetical protein
MTTTFRANNIEYSGNIKTTAGVTRGTILASNGTTFEYVTPNVSNQVLLAATGESGGVAWSEGPQGIGAGFGMPTAVTPTGGVPLYFLLDASTSYAPVMPLFTGTIVFFSIRPSYPNGWSSHPTRIAGGTVDYTFGYVGATTQPSTANFTAYPGAPHFQVMGTEINDAIKDYASFTTSLSIPISNGDQICIRIDNNLTFTGSSPTTYYDQNNAVVVRF